MTPGFSLAPIPDPVPSPATIANPRNRLRFRECSFFRAESRRGATSRFGLPACARKSLVTRETFSFGLWYVGKLTSGLKTTGTRDCSHGQSKHSDDHLRSGTIPGGRSDGLRQSFGIVSRYTAGVAGIVLPLYLIPEIFNRTHLALEEQQ